MQNLPNRSLRTPRPVRSILIILACCSVSLVCSAQRHSRSDRTATDTGRVEIEFNQSIQRHSRKADIRKICRTEVLIHGCTDFPSERLDANCKLTPGGWLIDASAEIQAVIQLSDNFKTSEVHVLMHELRHIAELTDSLHNHLTKVTSRRYQSEASSILMST